jgi:dolichol-phosphate mannosyltransferase
MNEEENLPLFYDTVKKVTDGLVEFDWEFIFIDDGSTDQSLQVLLGLRARDPRVSVIQLSRNFGSYAALRAGIERAWGDAVITISADLQDSPELFHDFVTHWKEGYHTVWGVRATREDPWNHRFLAGMFYRVIRTIALPGIPSGGMDCGLFDRKVVDALRQFSSRNAVMFLDIFSMGFRQKQVPYHRQMRRFGKSKWPLGKRMKAALDVITLYSHTPLRVASYVGLLLSSLSFLGGTATLFYQTASGGTLGRALLVAFLIFLAGLQFLCFGVLGEYVWRINSEIRGRPFYILMGEFEAEMRTRLEEPVHLKQGGGNRREAG